MIDELMVAHAAAMPRRSSRPLFTRSEGARRRSGGLGRAACKVLLCTRVCLVVVRVSSMHGPWPLGHLGVHATEACPNCLISRAMPPARPLRHAPAQPTHARAYASTLMKPCDAPAWLEMGLSAHWVREATGHSSQLPTCGVRRWWPGYPTQQGGSLCLQRKWSE